VATATVCAKFGLKCVVYMGAHDVERQAQRVPDEAAGRRGDPGHLRPRHAEGRDERRAARLGHQCRDTFYCIGTVAGPHPYPAMVRDFQAIIGKETRSRCMAAEGRLPDTLIAAIGGGSNAMGLFHPFLDDKEVAIIGVEAGGKGVDDEDGALRLADRRAAGRAAWQPHLPACRTRTARSSKAIRSRRASTIPGIGPEHAWLNDIGRATYVSVTDDEALDAFQLCCATEGIIPALEPMRHALAHVDPRSRRS
jgi:tryptophan synthase beta chain